MTRESNAMAEAQSWLQKFADWRAGARGNPMFRRGIAAAAAIGALDQAAKYWIVEILRLPARAGGRIELSGVFDLTYVQNRGVSFGLLAGGMVSRVILSLLSVIIAVVLVGWLAKIRRPVSAAGVALIIGGAVGNLIDRVAYGYVVDFLDFSGLFFPWIFNVADAAINIGIALLVIDWWRESKRGARDQ